MLFSNLRTAFSFLTILPFPHPAAWSDDDSGKSAIWYPFVGAVIGLIAAGFYWLSGKILPDTIAAVLVMILWVILTGGLHLDGLSDCCDGFFYSGTPEKRLQIMKDSYHGTFAVLGVTLMLLLKTVCITNLPVKECWLIFPLAAALGRLGILVIVRLPLANPNGMAASLKKSIPSSALRAGMIVPIGFAIALRLTGFVSLLSAVLIYCIISRLAKAKIGGINGDVLGMTVEITEIAVLLTANLTFLAGHP